MTSSADRHPMLRLVYGDTSPSAVVSRPGVDSARPARDAAVRVARENRQAALLGEDDARRILAVRAAEMIEGGTLAMIRPERRRRLMDLSSRLGLRPFDANLVIAIVQDAARSGGSVREPRTARRLSLVRGAGRCAGGSASVAWRFFGALLLAGAMFELILAWLAP